MADQYFPDKFILDNGPVSEISTDVVDPRVVYDGNGFRATDANGALVFELDAVAGDATFAGQLSLVEGATGVGIQDVNRVAWRDAAGTKREALYGTLTGTTRELFAEAGGQAAKILDSSGASSFVQTVSPNRQQRMEANQPSIRFATGYDTGITAALASGTDTAITINHNLGLNAVNCIAIGMLYDGFFSSLASWRCTLGNNSAVFNIGNPSSNPNVRAGLRVAFIYW